MKLSAINEVRCNEVLRNEVVLRTNGIEKVNLLCYTKLQ